MLYYAHGDIFVYSVDDWSKLRKDYRIVGQIIGNTSFIPSLPLKLLPEEAALLLNKELEAIQEVTDDIPPDENEIQQFEQKLLEEQQIEYKRIRRLQLETFIDKIIENRRQLGDDRSKEEILEDEVTKSVQVDKTNMIWPIRLKSQNKNKYRTVLLEDILKLTSKIKFEVFKDLWEKGYYITSGEKFGGDFLVYSGDPIVHHAVFIVRCVENNQTFTTSNLIAFGRLGVSVKKKAVLATLNNNIPCYVTINWMDA